MCHMKWHWVIWLWSCAHYWLGICLCSAVSPINVSPVSRHSNLHLSESPLEPLSRRYCGTLPVVLQKIRRQHTRRGGCRFVLRAVWELEKCEFYEGNLWLPTNFDNWFLTRQLKFQRIILFIHKSLKRIDGVSLGSCSLRLKSEEPGTLPRDSSSHERRRGLVSQWDWKSLLENE